MLIRGEIPVSSIVQCMDFRKYQNSLLLQSVGKRDTAGLYMVQVIDYFIYRLENGFTVEVPKSMTECMRTLCVVAMRITQVLRIADDCFVCECENGNWYLDQSWNPENGYMMCADPSAAAEFVKSRLPSFGEIGPNPRAADFIDLGLVLNW